MIPGIYNPAFPAPFLVPDLTDTLLIQSLELGGTDIGDGSNGLMVQVWKAWVDDGGTSIKISTITDTLAITAISGLTDVTSVSLGFDTNMNYSIGYIDLGVVKFKWYDSVAEDYTTTTFAGADSVKVATDDKRAGQSANRDVIVSYTSGGILYYRMQRDRYSIEYTVGNVGAAKLYTIGMHNALRFQFALQV
jgi:hypothetical protein